MVDPKNPASSTEAEQLPAQQGTAPVKDDGKGKGETQPSGEAAKAPVKKEEAKAFTPDDFKRYQASKDREIAELQKKHKAEVESVQSKITELVSKERERAKFDFIKEAEGKGIDKVEAAAIFDKRVNLEAKESELSRREKEINAALMMLGAERLVKEHSLEPASVEELLKAEDPKDMERIALRLEVERLRTGTQPPVTTDKGQQTPVKGDDWSKLDADGKLNAWLKQNIKET